VVPEICLRTDRQTDTQTDVLITIFRHRCCRRSKNKPVAIILHDELAKLMPLNDIHHKIVDGRTSLKTDVLVPVLLAFVVLALVSSAPSKPRDWLERTSPK